VLVTKNTYKSVRASTRARNTTPSSNEIATIFFCTISFQATTLNLLCWRFSRSCSLPRVGYAIFANRDFGQDLRFLRDAREIRKKNTIGLCACLSTVIVQSFAGRRASRAEEQCFARTLLYVFFSSRVTLFLGNAFFEFM